MGNTKIFWWVIGAIIIVLASGIVWKSGQWDGETALHQSWTVADSRDAMAPDSLLLTAWRVEDTTASDMPAITTDVANLATLYRQAASDDDAVTQYRILQALVAADTTQSTVLLPYIVHTALATHDFSGAFSAMITMQEQGTLLEYVRPTDFVYTLFNAIELHVKNLARIKKFVHDFAKDGVLTMDQRNFYDSIIAFTKGDTYNFLYFTKQLTGTYQWRQQTVARVEATLSGYKDPPPYYFDGLIALELFQQGYYLPVRLVAQRISKLDPKYILPYQLIAYASMHLSDRPTAINALQQLKLLDPDHRQLYYFLEAVATRSAGNFPQSIALFKQVTDPEYTLDVARYLLLLYDETHDTKRFLEQAATIATYSWLTVNDFYTVFDLVFFKPIRMQQPMDIFSEGYHSILTFLGRCKESIGEEYGYVCLYGKAGMFLAHGDEAKAYGSLQQVARWYPQPRLFQTLASLAKELGDEKQAKIWWTKALFGASKSSISDAPSLHVPGTKTLGIE